MRWGASAGWGSRTGRGAGRADRPSATAGTCRLTSWPAPSPGTGYAHWSPASVVGYYGDAGGGRARRVRTRRQRVPRRRHTATGKPPPARARRGRAGRASPGTGRVLSPSGGLLEPVRAALQGFALGGRHRPAARSTCRGSRSTTRSLRRLPAGKCLRRGPGEPRRAHPAMNAESTAALARRFTGVPPFLCPLLVITSALGVDGRGDAAFQPAAGPGEARGGRFPVPPPHPRRGARGVAGPIWTTPTSSSSALGSPGCARRRRRTAAGSTAPCSTPPTGRAAHRHGRRRRLPLRRRIPGARDLRPGAWGRGRLDALDLRAFTPAAAIRAATELHASADLRRRPALAARLTVDRLVPLATRDAGSLVGPGPGRRSVLGRALAAGRRRRPRSGRCLRAGPRTSAPFLSGLLGERALRRPRPSSAGLASLRARKDRRPADGMGAFPAQLAAGLLSRRAAAGPSRATRPQRARAGGRRRARRRGGRRRDGPGDGGGAAARRGRAPDVRADDALRRAPAPPAARTAPASRRHRGLAGQHLALAEAAPGYCHGCRSMFSLLPRDGRPTPSRVVRRELAWIDGAPTVDWVHLHIAEVPRALPLFPRRARAPRRRAGRRPSWPATTATPCPIRVPWSAAAARPRPPSPTLALDGGRRCARARKSRARTQKSRTQTQDSRAPTQDSRARTQDSRAPTQDSRRGGRESRDPAHESCVWVPEICVPVRVLCVPVRRSMIGMGYDRTGSCRAATAPLRVDQLGPVEYRTAWHAQRAHAAARRAGTGPDVLMLLEHPPVYTAGKGTRPADRPTDGTPVVYVDRGGRITWHGPVQLVGYPLVALADPLGRRRLRPPPGGGADRRVRRPGPVRRGRVDGRTGSGCPPTTVTPNARSAPSAYGSRAGDACTASRSTATPTSTCLRPHRAVRHRRCRGHVTGRRARVAAYASTTCARRRPAVAAALDGALPVAEHAVARPPAPARLDVRLHPALQ